MKEIMKIKQMPNVSFEVITKWHTPSHTHTHTLAQYDIHRKEDMPEKKICQRKRYAKDTPEKKICQRKRYARWPDACYSFFVVEPWVVHTKTGPVRLFSVLRLKKKGRKKKAHDGWKFGVNVFKPVHAWTVVIYTSLSLYTHTHVEQQGILKLI